MEILSFQLSKDDLNTRLGGGIPRGTIVLIEGDHGTGKSVIGERMAYGFLNNNHTVTVVSTQLTTTDFMKQMYSMDYPVIKHIVHKSLLFIPVFSVVNPDAVQNHLLEKLAGASHLFESEVVVIDTISRFLKPNTNSNQVISFFSFLKRLTSTGKVIVLCMNEKEMDSGIATQLRSVADIAVLLSQKMVAGNMKYTITVSKYNRAAAQFMRVVGFRIQPHIGLTIETTSVV